MKKLIKLSIFNFELIMYPFINRYLTLVIMLYGLAACSTKQEKVQKTVTVEMSVKEDSTAKATVTITTDSAGNEVQTFEVIQGTPESVKMKVEKYRKKP